MTFMFRRLFTMVAFICLTAEFAHAQRMESALTPFTSVGNLILVPARINGGQPLTFVFDTGEDTTIIDAGVARQLGLAIENPHDAAVPGGAVQVGGLSNVTVAVGPALLKNMVVQAGPISPLSGVIGVPISGIIGHDFLREFATKIDYAKHTLTFWNPQQFEYKGKGVVIPVVIDNGEVFFPVQLKTLQGAEITGKFKLDTGSLDTLGMNNNFVSDHHLIGAQQPKIPTLGAAMGGDTLGFDFRLQSARVGSTVFKSPVVSCTTDSKGFENRNDAGTIGAAFLSHFTVFLDYSRNRLILESESRETQTAPPDAVGATLRAEGDDLRRIVIHDIAAGSPAERAGLRDGDEIQAVEGQHDLPLGVIWVKFHREGPLRLTVKRADGLHDVSIMAHSRLP